MLVEELMALRKSNDAPFNNEQYTVWLYNQIVDRAMGDILNEIDNIDNITIAQEGKIKGALLRALSPIR